MGRAVLDRVIRVVRVSHLCGEPGMGGREPCSSLAWEGGRQIPCSRGTSILVGKSDRTLTSKGARVVTGKMQGDLRTPNRGAGWPAVSLLQVAENLPNWINEMEDVLAQVSDKLGYWLQGMARSCVLLSLCGLRSSALAPSGPTRIAVAGWSEFSTWPG